MSERDLNICRSPDSHVKQKSGGVSVSTDLNTDSDRAKQRRRALIADRLRVLRLVGGLDETMVSL